MTLYAQIFSKKKQQFSCGDKIRMTDVDEILIKSARVSQKTRKYNFIELLTLFCTDSD